MSAPRTNDGELRGQVAVVTGASRSIGLRIARTLARHGATVISLDLQAPEHADPAIRTLMLDVTDEGSVRGAFGTVRGEYGGVDILVNNAGLFSTLERAPFWKLAVDEWDRVMRANVRSVFLCTRAASETMRAVKRGRIVNLASGAASFGMGELLHYVTSKAAIVGMTRSLARELGPFGVTVNAVAPGLVTTELTQQTVPAAYRRLIAETQVIDAAISGDDVAEAVRYLCSPGARLVTGQTVLVNGGATMGAA